MLLIYMFILLLSFLLFVCFYCYFLVFFLFLLLHCPFYLYIIISYLEVRKEFTTFGKLDTFYILLLYCQSLSILCFLNHILFIFGLSLVFQLLNLIFLLLMSQSASDISFISFPLFPFVFMSFFLFFPILNLFFSHGLFESAFSFLFNIESKISIAYFASTILLLYLY